ncbi:hypothetical protein DERF_014883 [Dermatophagoides farinae]|uniref:Uncharacterized protein n=1 Tax=Dermatophagoides farinae TaxID=6954 RepID=A0A922L1P7_DERFA|nr:hypothetical protein DERF_014883 [Dermatophagoides farinae]
MTIISPSLPNHDQQIFKRNTRSAIWPSNLKSIHFIFWPINQFIHYIDLSFIDFLILFYCYHLFQ